MPPLRSMVATLLLAAGVAAPSASPPDVPSPARSAAPPRYALTAGAAWHMALPDFEPFGASCLLRLPDGTLLTASDHALELFRVGFQPQTNLVRLERLDTVFTESQLAPFAPRRTGRYDLEGLARDDQGRLYVCEERDRWVLRCDPRNGTVELLDIDWSPAKRYFSRVDRNASWEGIAVGGNRLFLANERDSGRIVAVDLDTLKIVDVFAVVPSGRFVLDPHYTDLSWHGGALFVLMREERMVLRIDSTTHRTLAEYDYSAIESAPEHRYEKRIPFVGIMEGLAVDDDHLWLVTDNNNLPRVADPGDRRPTLFRCDRPDR